MPRYRFQISGHVEIEAGNAGIAEAICTDRPGMVFTVTDKQSGAFLFAVPIGKADSVHCVCPEPQIVAVQGKYTMFEVCHRCGKGPNR